MKRNLVVDDAHILPTDSIIQVDSERVKFHSTRELTTSLTYRGS